MDVGAAHHRGEDLSRCRGVGEIDYDEPRRIADSRINTKKRVERSIDALDFGGVNSRVSQSRRVAGNQLRLQWIGQAVDHYRAWRELGRDDQQLTVITCLNVTERRCTGYDDRINERRYVPCHVPDLYRVATRLPKSPGSRVRDVAPDPHFGGEALRHGA